MPSPIPSPRIPVSRLLTTAMVLGLAACGDDNSTAAPETTPSTEFRRLVVSDTAPFARIFDAATGQRVDSMGSLPSRVTYLYTAKGRIAFAHFQTRNQVSFIDGGVFEQNGRGVKQTPRIVGSFSDQTPIHGNYNGDMVSVHFDGSGNVRFWSEQGVASGNTAPMATINTGMAHHGAGMSSFDGGLMSASLRDPNGTSPIGVVVYNRQGQEVGRNTACPGLHGLAGNASGKLYGCADGGLLVSATGSTVSFQKISHATDARFGIGTVWARDGQPNFLVRMSIRGQPVSAATRALGVAQVSTRTMSPISIPGNDIDWTADIDYSGRHALVIGRSGNLYIVDMATRQVTGTLNGLVPAMPTSGTVLTPFFAFADGLAYITSPTQGRVYEVSISATGSPSIARTMNVGGTPERIVVLGVRDTRALQR